MSRATKRSGKVLFSVLVVAFLGVCAFFGGHSATVVGHGYHGDGITPTDIGGTGIDSSGSTGMGRIDAGTWTVAELSGDVATSGSNAVVIQVGAVDDAMLASKLVKRTATFAWGTVIFAGGRPVDGELVTFNGRKYEYDTDSTFPENSGDVIWNCNGNANIDDDINDLVTAVNGDSATVFCTGDTANDLMFLVANAAGAAGNSITLLEAAANTDVSAATFVDGQDAVVGVTRAITHTITTTEAAGGTSSKLLIETGLTTIQALSLTFLDAGVVVASTDTISAAGGIISIVMGVPNWANGDEYHIIVVGTE